MSVSTVTGMLPPPPPDPLASADSPGVLQQPSQRRAPRPNHTWAAAYAAIGGSLVTGYFLLASIVALLTLDGQPSEEQQHQSDQLLTAAGLVVLLTPLGAIAARSVVRWAQDRDQSGTALMVVVIGWVVSFAAAFFLLEPFPSADRPVAFGAVWAFGGMVVGPAVAAAVAYAGASRSRNRLANR